MSRPAGAFGSLVACLLILLSACASNRPIHYYAIDRPPVTEAPGKPDGLVLVVGRIAAPEPLQDGRIRYRSGSNEAGAYEYHRWTERPDAMVRDMLVEALRASGHYRQAQETSVGAAVDYRIRGKLYEFSEVDQPAIQTRISLQLEVVSGKTGLVVWNRHYNRDEPVHGKTMNEVVASLNRNLQQVIADSTSAIDSFLSSQIRR